MSSSLPSPSRSFRNRVAHRLANAALRLATPDYRDFIGGAIRYGMNSAARDAVEDRPRPEPWEVLARATSVTALPCKCRNPKRDFYRGRDGYYHCEQCDGIRPRGLAARRQSERAQKANLPAVDDL